MCIEPNGKNFFSFEGTRAQDISFFLAWQLMKAYSVMTSVETKGVIDYNRRLISTRTEKKVLFFFAQIGGGLGDLTTTYYKIYIYIYLS